MLKNVNKKFLCILLYIFIVNNYFILGVFLVISFYCFVYVGVFNIFFVIIFFWLVLIFIDRYVI